MTQREQVPTAAVRTAAAAFAAAALAAAGFAADYVLGASTQVEGGCLAAFCFAVAIGLTIWSRHFVPHEMYAEPREPMQPPAIEHGRLQDALDDGVRRVPPLVRRSLLLSIGTFGAALLFPLRSLLFKGPAPLASLTTTVWRPGVRLVTPEGAPVRLADVPDGAFLTVVPETDPEAADAVALLLRLDPTRVHPAMSRAGWDIDGVFCFSKLCTHAGCPIALFEQTTLELLCPCHQSVFDLTRDAAPIQGPAVRPLPQLPLQVGADGVLAAGGGFSDDVGASWWRRG